MRERIRKTSISYRFPTIFLLAYLVVLLFFSGNDTTTNMGVVIPFINVKAVYLLCAIIAFSFLLVCAFSQMKMDVIAFLLLFRIFLCFFPIVYTPVPSGFLGNIINSTFPFFVYFIFLNTSTDGKKATKIFTIFGIVVAIQCILAYLIIKIKGYASYSDLFYKNYFVIPIGATNNISAVLLPLMIIGAKTLKRFKISYVALLVLAVFLCKSRTGLLLCALYFFVEFVRKIRKDVLVVLIIALPLLLVVSWLVIRNSEVGIKIQELLLGYSSKGDGLNALMSGRLDVYKNVFNEALKHPILGNGIDYEKFGFMRSHNVFLQTFYENGIVGLILFVVFCGLSIERIRQARKLDNIYRAFAFAMIFVFINALVEDVIFADFTVIFGLFFLANMKQNIGKTGEIENVQG